MKGVAKRLDLPGGDYIVLLDTLAKKDLELLECVRNIFLMDSSRRTIWQIHSDFDNDGGPFTNVIYENGGLRAYRWDGGIYKIDMQSGRASPEILAR